MSIRRRWLRVALIFTCTVLGTVLLLRMAGTVAESARPASPPKPPAWQRTTAGDNAPAAILEPDLARELAQAGPHDRFQIIVEMRAKADVHAETTGTTTIARRRNLVAALQSTATRAQAGIRNALRVAHDAGQVEQITPFWIFDGLALRNVTPALIREIATRHDVSLIRLDHRRRWLPERPVAKELSTNDGTPTWGLQRIRAPEVWSALQVTGTGVVVANMDTGVDWLHPALQKRYRGYDPKGFPQHEGNWYDATDVGALYPVDGYGHGTHTMGTIVGQNGTGVAPGARWIAVRVLNNAGIGYDSWIHAGFQWILAPGGDPNRAPDLVSNSWGNSTGGLTTFQDDVAALRAAGIFPLFAAGNEGPSSVSVDSPASLPGAFAVGASDEDDEVASFSGRGPSPWGEIRPHVVAPGVNIRSSLPGGAYQEWDGTSMATPHVAGTVALLRSARPDLTITETASVLTRTAAPLTTTHPNNDSGWGRIDAYAAVALATQAGLLSGTVTSGGNPLSGVSVTAIRLGSVPGAETNVATTGPTGHYQLPLTAGAYDLTAGAFGYAPQTIHHQNIVTAQVSIHNFTLSPLPTGQIAGTVRAAGSSDPVSATVSVLGTPVTATAAPGDGRFELSLPGGLYTLDVRALGYRVLTVTVTVTQGETTIQDMALTPSPRILLVDSGRWYYKSALDYYRQTLDDLNYTYDVWRVKHPPADTPTLSGVLPYDLVIWSAPRDGIYTIHANETITGYLAQGGNLFLSGQDVAFWDNGGSGLTYAPYFDSYLYAQYVKDNAASRTVTGLPNTLFAGLTMTIEGPGGANNQLWPDVIAARNRDYADPVLGYVGDGSAGLQVGLCRPYRVLLLSYGFEAINKASTRRAVMQRSLDWFASPRLTVGLQVSALNSAALVGPPGTVVTHVVRIRNIGEQGNGDTIHLSLDSAEWPTEILSPTLSLAPCESAYVPLRVTIPLTATWNQNDPFTLTVHSTLSPTEVHTLAMVSKAPAPVLLVDDDRWYPQEEVYKEALASTGIPFDLWDVQQKTFGAGSPDTGTLQLYPVVLWFTGYDWFDPLQPSEESRLIAYLESGGRLFLSSQDYLYYGYGSSFAKDYLGVMTYTEWITPTQAVGVPGDPLGGGLEQTALHFPFPNWSDRVTPMPEARVVFRDQLGRAIALRRTGKKWRTVFLAFPFEALPAAARPSVMARIVGWLSWLGQSKLEAGRGVVAAGESITYTLALHQDSALPVSQATVSNTLPDSTQIVPGSLQGGAAYDPLDRRVHWSGPLAAGQQITFTYRAQTAGGLPAGQALHAVAHFRLDDYGIGFDRTDWVRVGAPNLARSALTVTPPIALPGQIVTLTLALRNTGLRDAPTSTVRIPLPQGTTWITGTFASRDGGIVDEEPTLLTWYGSIPLSRPVTLTVQARSSPITASILPVPFTALWDDGMGNRGETGTWLWIRPYRFWMPLVFR